MSRFSIWAVGFLVFAMVLACAAPAAAPASRPVENSADAEWDAIVAAARREGRLTVIGPLGSDIQDALTAGFQKRYPGIAVDFSSLGGSQVAPKLMNEREAGQFLTDIYIGGPTTTVTAFIPAGAVAPIRPYLYGSEILEGANWLGGKLSFSDDGELYSLVFNTNVKAPLAYNPSLVPAGSIRSYRDLLDPRWRGKITMPDPRVAGAGQVTITFLYAHPSFGKEFLQQLFANGVAVSADGRQVLDWVGKGQYPIGLAANDTLATEMMQKGIPIELLGSEAFAEGSYITAGVGSVSVIDRAPHPNATKLYLRYLLSQQGQQEWSNAAGYTSRRVDVKTDHLPPFVVPKPNLTYWSSYAQSSIALKDEIDAFLKTVIPN